MYLPNEIITTEDLRIVASFLKRMDLKIPLKGYRLKNGEQRVATYAYVKATDAGDDILLETTNVQDTRVMPLSDIYPQIVDYIKKHVENALIA